MIKFLIVGFTLKAGLIDGGGVNGYHYDDSSDAMPSYDKIKSDCLKAANNNSIDRKYDYFKIDFMQFVSKEDYYSFFESNEE